MQVFIRPGDDGKAKMPASEVCMYMRICGREMLFHFLPDSYMVQLFDESGREFSFPIHFGEAGIYRDYSKEIDDPQAFYYYR
jgi:hypothetical protein